MSEFPLSSQRGFALTGRQTERLLIVCNRLEDNRKHRGKEGRKAARNPDPQTDKTHREKKGKKSFL